MDEFTYVRSVNFDQIGPEARYSQKLLDRATGAEGAAISYIQTPPGGGSPRGLHTHEFEQIFFVIEGTMAVEVGGRRFDVGAGSLVVFPAGTPHRNWNASEAAVTHLSIKVPAPPAKRTGPRDTIAS